MKSKSAKLDSAMKRAGGTEETDSEKAKRMADDARRKAAEDSIPDGYEDQSTDVAGFWKQDGAPIHFIPIECRMMDSSIDKTKSSTLVIGRLVGKCELVDGEGVVVDGEPGDAVGIWAKPGMQALAILTGVPVYMYLDSHKDVGKASPMAVFAVMSKGRGTLLPIARDTRIASKGTRDALGLSTDPK